MGHWGTGPLENDSAGDWFYQLEKKSIVDLIEAGLNSKDYDEVRAAAWLLERVGLSYVYPLGKLDRHKQLAVYRLTAIAHDTVWIERWKEPKDIRAAVLAQMYRLADKK